MNLSSHTGIVHQGIYTGVDIRGRDTYAKECGMYNTTEFTDYRSSTDFFTTEADVTCKRCLNRLAKKAAAKAAVAARDAKAAAAKTAKATARKTTPKKAATRKSTLEGTPFAEALASRLPGFKLTFK